MTGYQTALLTIGSAGLLGFLLCSAFLRLRTIPAHTRRALKIAAILCLAFFLCMTATVFAQGKDSPFSGIRYLPWIISGVPIALFLGYIARHQANSLVTVMGRPRLRAVLNSTTYVLLLDWFATLIFGLLLSGEPRPLYLQPQSDYETSVWAVLERILLLGVELIYLCTIGAVFLEASGPRTPSRNLRIRNFAFFLGTACWTLTELVEMCLPLTGYLLPVPSAASAYATLILVQAFLLSLSVIFWLFGLNRHQSRTAVDDWLMQVLEWSRLREILGLARSKVRFLPEHPLATHEHHLTVAAKSLGLDQRELRKALMTLQMVCALAPSQNRVLSEKYGLRIRRKDLLKCAALQDQLMRKQEVSGLFRLSSNLGDRRAYYDLDDDPLHEALRPTLQLTSFPLHLDLSRCPQWLQLAAVAVAQAELIDGESRICVLGSKVIDQKALMGYSFSIRSSSEEHLDSVPRTS